MNSERLKDNTMERSNHIIISLDFDAGCQAFSRPRPGYGCTDERAKLLNPYSFTFGFLKCRICNTSALSIQVYKLKSMRHL